MTDKPKPPKMRHSGQFKKGDPRARMGGRKKKTVEWKVAEDALRQAIPLVMMMTEEQLEQALGENPIMAFKLAAEYLKESPDRAVERFLGRMPQTLVGAEGKPLIPAQTSPLPPIDFNSPLWTPEKLDAFIASTQAAASKARQITGPSTPPAK